MNGMWRTVYSSFVFSDYLAQGVPPNTIVAKIRASTAVSSNEPSRWQLVTTKDLHNIRDKFKIGKKKRTETPRTSEVLNFG